MEDLLAAIDPSELVELAATLVRIPSHPGTPDQERAVVGALAQFLMAHDLESHVEDVVPGRPNLLSTVTSERDGPHLVLCGHTDTVPLNAADPGVGLSGVVRDGRLEGRGSADMKGAIAGMAVALVALARTNALPRGSVTLAAVIDEEMESLGAEHLVKSRFAADGAIVGEATENRLAIGHKGLEWIEIDIEGRSAHGGKPQAGVNAIVAASRFIELSRERLLPQLSKRAHPLLGPPTLNFGTIVGGDQPSTVAGRCLLRVDRRTVPGESWESVSGELTELGAVVEAEMPGARVSVRRMPGSIATLEHVALVTPEDQPLVGACTEALREMRADVSPAVFPAWSDAALLTSYAGIPSVILGPGDLALAHSPRESVAVAELVDAAKIYALAARRFCAS